MAERRVALVTGGSRGIGRGVVLRLAADGYDVAFCYRSRADEAERTVRQARALGARVLARPVDVALFTETRALVADTEERLGPLDALVTSAGVVRDRPLVMMEPQDWSEVHDTNLTGVFHACRAAVFSFLKRRHGCIVTISSVAGVHGHPGQTNYSAAKAGIIGFSRALAKEIGRYGIRVNTVAPGFIDTDMTAALPDSVRRSKLAAIPLARWGTVDEVADLVSFLVSDRASYITAQTVCVDGGIVI